MSQNPLFEQALHYQQAGEMKKAIACYQALLEMEEDPAIYANWGVALRMQGHLEAAVSLYRRALSLNPNQISALSNLGGVLRALGQLQEAQAVLEQAIVIAPEFAAAHYNLGLVFMDAHQPERAIACFDQAIALEPSRVDAPFDRATCLLQTGDLQKGFEAYECRFSYEPRLVKAYQQSKWDGSSLQDRTLLLYTEQGFGDALQFCRYIPLIPKDSGQIIVECPVELKRLMEMVEGVDLVICPGDPLPAFDVHYPLLSLPYHFQTTIDSIPQSIPYFQLSKQPPITTLPQPIGGHPLKIGIVWSSGHRDVGVRSRRIPVSYFLRLLELPNMALYSFQKGPAVNALEQHGVQSFIPDLGALASDFWETAHWLQQMDLLISSDTAIVHLAGALGKPVWVLLPYGSEWRWLLDRFDSPWYPSMRLFRQSEPLNWDPVFETVLEALRTLQLDSTQDWSALVSEAG